MNKKQRQAALNRFEGIMQRLGAAREPPAYEGCARISYHLPWGGFNLNCTMWADDTDWVACKWDIDDKALQADYHASRNGLDDSSPASTAAWEAMTAARAANRAKFEALGLPHHNPYSLKWNHHGETADDALDSLEQGLAAHPNNK